MFGRRRFRKKSKGNFVKQKTTKKDFIESDYVVFNPKKIISTRRKPKQNIIPLVPQSRGKTRNPSNIKSRITSTTSYYINPAIRRRFEYQSNKRTTQIHTTVSRAKNFQVVGIIIPNKFRTKMYVPFSPTKTTTKFHTRMRNPDESIKFLRKTTLASNIGVHKIPSNIRSTKTSNIKIPNKRTTSLNNDDTEYDEYDTADQEISTRKSKKKSRTKGTVKIRATTQATNEENIDDEEEEDTTDEESDTTDETEETPAPSPAAKLKPNTKSANKPKNDKESIKNSILPNNKGGNNANGKRTTIYEDDEEVKDERKKSPEEREKNKGTEPMPVGGNDNGEKKHTTKSVPPPTTRPPIVTTAHTIPATTHPPPKPVAETNPTPSRTVAETMQAPPQTVLATISPPPQIGALTTRLVVVPPAQNITSTAILSTVIVQNTPSSNTVTAETDDTPINAPAMSTSPVIFAPTETETVTTATSKPLPIVSDNIDSSTEKATTKSEDEVDMNQIMIVPKMTPKYSSNTKLPSEYENYDFDSAAKEVEGVTKAKKDPLALMNMFKPGFGTDKEANNTSSGNGTSSLLSVASNVLSKAGGLSGVGNLLGKVFKG
jgi:hypothetical protein